MIFIQILGTPEILHNEIPLRISRVTVRSLLFYLACNPKGVTRANLINTLWPDVDQAPRRLTESLSKLRSELVEEDALMVEKDGVTLNKSIVRVDLWEFERIFDRIYRAAIQTPPESPLPAAVVENMRAAIALWRSPSLLDGAELVDSPELDQFLIARRLQVENNLFYMYRRLSLHAQASGDLAEAIRIGEEGLRLDPTHPELNYFVIQSLYRVGRPRAALDRYELMRTYYDPQDISLRFFQPLLDEIRQRDVQTAPLTQHPQIAWSDWKISNQAFVGRADILTRLQKTLQRGGVVALIGEAGMGKTRLVHEFYQGLKPRPRVFLARGHRTERSQPLQVLIESMRISILAEDWQRMDRVWATYLAQLLPEIRQYRNDLPAVENMPLEDMRFFYFEAFRQIVLTMSSPHKGLFLIDDAQWIDLTSLDMFSYLIERDSFKDHGLLLFNIRPEEPNVALQSFLHKHSQDGLEIIPVQGLSMEDVSVLTQKILGIQPSSSLVQRLAGETGGNPLFLVETLRELSACTPEELANVRRLPITQNMRSLIEERLALLDTDQRSLVEMAAVLGNEFEISELETTLELKEGKAALILDRLNRLNMVQPVGGIDPGKYRFVHEKTREIILEELTPARQRWLHRCAARVLAGKDILPSRLAYHYAQAGDALPAFRHWVKAAEYGLRLFSVPEALQAYAQAESYIAELPMTLKEEEINHFYTQWGDIAVKTGLWDEAYQIYQRQKTLGDQRHSALLTGSAFSGLADLYIFTSKPQESLQAIQKALFYLNQTRDVEQILKACKTNGLLMVYMNRFKDALQVMENGMQMRGEGRSPKALRAQIDLIGSLSGAYSLTGLPGKGFEVAIQAVIDSREMDYTMGVVNNFVHAVIALQIKGDYSVCCAYAEEAIRLADAVHYPRLRALTQYYLSRSLSSLGRCDEAWEQAQEALAAGKKGSFPEVASGALSALGDIYLYLFDFPNAAAAYQEGIAAQPFGAPNLDNQARLALANLCMQPGESTLDALQKIIEEIEATGLDAVGLPLWAFLGVALAILGRLEEAQQIVERLRSEVPVRGINLLDLIWEGLQALLAFKRCQKELALSHLKVAIEKAVKAEDKFVQLYFGIFYKHLAGQAIAIVPSPMQLLDELEAHCRSRELHESYRAFRQKLKALAVPTPHP